MSGIEVAGLVLGGFPLLISVLEHYRQGWETLEDWFEIKTQYKKSRQDIDTQQAIFEDNLERLLGTLVRNDDHLKALLAEPGGDQWRDVALDEGLRARLPRSYDVYLRTVSEINSIMDGLKHQLGDGLVSFQSKVACEIVSVPILDPSITTIGKNSRKSSTWAAIEHQKHRIKFVLNKRPREKLLSELADCNSKLQTLLESSDALATLRLRRKGRSDPSKKLDFFWQHARTIYRLLKQAWCCDCATLHHANLLLQHRKTPEVELEVAFIFCWNASQREMARWKYQKTTIKHVAELATLNDGVPTVQAPSARTIPKKSVHSLIVRPVLRSSDKRRTKGVTWAIDASPQRSLGSAMSAPIMNLCDTITKATDDLKCFGKLVGQDDQYILCPTHERDGASVPSEDVTLATLLSKHSPMKLTRRQRYSIAVTLASSHLQLQSSPWLAPQWDKKTVRFHSVDGKVVLTDRPFISRDFVEAPTNTQEPTSSFMLGSKGIPSLGIILLELCFGIPLEEHEIRQRYLAVDGQPNPVLDLVAAIEWCDRHANDEAGPEYASAIEWCLKHSSMRQSADEKQDQAWREELFQHVVEPLQSCHRQLSSELPL